MNALSQGSAGVALVIAFALLRTRHAGAATILLTIQSSATAVSLVAGNHPVLAIPPVLLAATVWLTRRHTAMPPMTDPAGGAKLAIIAGIMLAILCQSNAGPSLPLTIVLLSGLLAATRLHPLMRLIALVTLQNGIALAASMATQLPPLFPVACLLLPLPFAASLLSGRLDLPVLPRLGWIVLTLALGMFLATLIVPLDPYASLFAPLIAFAGILRAWNARNRATPVRQAAMVVQLAFTLAAVVAPSPVAAWLALVVVLTGALAPVLPRRQDVAVLAFIGAGLALFALLRLPVPLLGYLSLFLGYAMIAACVPDLAIPLVILLLRQTSITTLPDNAAVLLLGLTSAALLICSFLLIRIPLRNHDKWLKLSQTAIVLLPLGLGSEDGRFAAVVLLILLILTNLAAALAASARVMLFPGLALTALAISGPAPWLLLPFGAGVIAILLDFGRPKAMLTPANALPLALAFLIGTCTPNSLVRWLHTLAAGRP